MRKLKSIYRLALTSHSTATLWHIIVNNYRAITIYWTLITTSYNIYSK